MKHSIFKWLKTLMIGLSLMLSAGAAQAVPTTDQSTLLLSGFNEAGWIKQADEYIKTLERYNEQVNKWKEEFDRYTNQFKQASFGSLASLVAGTDVKVPDGDGQNGQKMKEFINTYNANSRCNKMTKAQGVAYDTCWARHRTEVQKMQEIANLMDYNDTMDKQIKDAIASAEKIDGSSEAQKKAAALASVQALQNKVRDTNNDYTNRFKSYDATIAAYKSQQAVIAQQAMSGKSSLVGSLITTGLTVGAFQGLKALDRTCSKGTYATYGGNGC